MFKYRCIKSTEKVHGIVKPLRGFECKFHYIPCIFVCNIKFQEEIVYDLPPNICNSCQKFLEDFNTFIESFKTNDTFLKGFLKEQKLKQEDKDSESHSHESEDVGHSYEDFVPIKNDTKQNIQNIINIESENETTKLPEECKLKKIKSRQTKSDSRTKRKRIEECSCNICGNKFTRLGGLKRHMKIHMGIKPFKCKICEKTFVEKATLARHSLVHSGKRIKFLIVDNVLQRKSLSYPNYLNFISI